MRSLAQLALFAAAWLVTCAPQQEVVRQNGNWTLLRVPRSHENNSTQYEYDLRHRDRPIAVAGDLLTPIGTFTMAAPTDRFSDSGWLSRSALAVKLVDPPVTSSDIAVGHYSVKGLQVRRGTPDAWVLQWFEPDIGVWMDPEKLFDPSVARKLPPQRGVK